MSEGRATNGSIITKRNRRSRVQRISRGESVLCTRIRAIGDREAIIEVRIDQSTFVNKYNILRILIFWVSKELYFHISQSYGVSESTAYKTVRWIEDTLIKHPDFALPGRKALLKSELKYEVVLIDATETPIERPKKNKSISIQERRKNTPWKVRLL